eukprot:3140126-Prymnesium_polylepis.1
MRLATPALKVRRASASVMRARAAKRGRGGDWTACAGGCALKAAGAKDGEGTQGDGEAGGAA